MRPVQNCHVCGTAGYLVDGRIVVTGEEGQGPPSVGQCPRCLRFVCSRHGEPLAITGGERRGLLRRSPSGPMTICCPFDRGVPLGGR
jgi:hypothetical protein